MLSTSMLRQLLALALLASLLGAAQAYPWLYSGSSCTAHPSKGVGGKHGGAAALDTGLKFTVSNSTKTGVTSLCPGKKYNVKVYSSNKRQSMLTTSAGKFTGASSSCPSRVNQLSKATSFTKELTAPCTSGLTSLTLKATSSTGESSSFKYNSKKLTLNQKCRTSC